MLKKIAMILGLGIVAVLGYAAMQAEDYMVSREITIHAPPERIFPYLNNSKLADQWGPWLQADPSAKISYSGPAEGVGAKTSWAEGKQLGTGSATIVESIPNQRVKIKIEYTEPMGMVQDSIYAMQPSGENQVVTWSVSGKNSFLARVMCVVMMQNIDKIVGGMFEKGLAKLKTTVETLP